MDDLTVGFTLSFPCPFNWKIAVETFMECYHHIGAHSKTLEPKERGGDSWGVPMDDPDQGWIALRHPLRADLPTSEMLVPGLPVFEGWTDEQLRTGNLYTVFPNHIFGTSGNAVRWTTLIPKSATETWWIRHHLVHKERAEEPRVRRDHGARESLREGRRGRGRKREHAAEHRGEIRLRATRTAEPP